MTQASPASRLVALFVYATAMGWLEAVVVVYIRALLGIAPGEPIPPQADVMGRLRSIPWLVRVEQGRELATLIMLAGVAWVATRGWRGRIGALLVCFGTWDIVYYIGLYAMLRWPPSLAAMDLLFLIPPHPLWYQPVWLPVSIAAVMIGAGTALFLRPTAPPVRSTPSA